MSDNLRTTENVNTRGGAEKMGTMPEGRLLASMAWPAILSMTINALYNIVDSIFVARISQGALTAVSFVLPVQLLMVALTIGSGVGVNSVISRRLGAKRFEEANNAASMSVRIGIFNYLIFLLISIFATVPFMRHYTDDPEIFGHGVTYMRLVFALSIFSSVEVILQKVLQAMGNMKAPMICSVTGCLINVIFDPILIFGMFGFPKLGVAGAAIATVFGQFVAFWLAVYFLKKQNTLTIKLIGFKMDWKTIKDIYSVSLPSIFMQAIGSFMLIGYNTIIAAEPVAVAVLGVYQKLQTFVFMPVLGLNQGSLPIIGYNYGARNKGRVMRTYKLALIAAFCIMTCGFILFQFAAPLFLKLFNANEAMMALGVPALKRISICFFPAAYGIVTSSMFQATGHAHYSFFSSLIRQLVGILPLAFILYRVGGVELSWYSFSLAEILGTAYLIWAFARLYNRKLKHLEEPGFEG